MQNRSSVKNRRPPDINQLAKAIVDLATGNPTVEDPPVELKKRPLTRIGRGETKGNKARVRKRKESAKKSVGAM